jgi:hypothetical protein
MNVDRQLAMHNARTELAQMIKLRIEAVQKVYAEQTGSSSSTTFESASETVTRESLEGSTIERIEEVKVDGQKQLCLIMGLSSQQSKMTFNNLIQKSGVDMRTADEASMYAAFAAL